MLGFILHRAILRAAFGDRQSGGNQRARNELCRQFKMEGVLSEAKHVDYFRNRALAERELARAAPTEYIARIHTEMAEHYEALIDAPVQRNVLRIVGESLATA